MSERERVARAMKQRFTDGNDSAVWEDLADAALSAMDRPKLPARVVEAVEKSVEYLPIYWTGRVKQAAAALRATHIIVKDQPNE